MTSCRVAVAYSGGRDSTALLHAVLMSVRDTGTSVAALHVHHGLSVQADAWERHCRDQCARWQVEGFPVSFAACRLRTRPQPGDSIEAWARRERYAALGRLARTHGADVVLLAHHRRDQAETLILQALRSAGVAGLAGMPRAIERDGIHWLRPWLDVPRSTIEAYVESLGLSYIDDDSNTDERHARNRLRLRVWPALVQAFPEAEPALAAAATWAQQAQACLDELASDDLALLHGPAGLQLVGLGQLSAARRVNALRAWLRRQTGAAPPASLLARLSDELFGVGAASWPLAGGLLRRHRGQLTWSRPVATRSPSKTALEAQLHIRRAGIHRLPGWGGQPARRSSEGGRGAAGLAGAGRASRAIGRRAVSGRSGAPCAQPEEAVPGRGAASLGAQRAPRLQRWPTGVRAGARHRRPRDRAARSAPGDAAVGACGSDVSKCRPPRRRRL
jgi:tRNA(Ile)-lysidine synthase